MDGAVLLVVITFLVIAVVVVTMTLILIQKQKARQIQKEVQELDREKNLIASTPVISELEKVETIVKNNKMEEKYKNWQHRFEQIKEDRLTKINDMIIDLDLSITTKDYKEARAKIAKAELELYKAKNATNHLMSEIKEITVSEEKYRSILIKLKAKYRELSNEFQAHKSDYDEVQIAIDLQFENIEKRFLDFENAMEKNQYQEVVHIVKALDSMIDHMSIVIEEVPQLILLSKQLIPKRIEEIEETYAKMKDAGYPLDYLNISYNMDESRKNITGILDRIKVLNLESCMFELKTMLDYLDSLFKDFENEKAMRKLYEENISDFDKKVKRVNKIVADIYHQMDDIKKMYDLKNEDIETMNQIKKRLMRLDSDYKNLLDGLSVSEKPFSQAYKELDLLTVQLQQLEEDLDTSLKSLGSMYDDELRAREQLDEIQVVLKQCRLRIRSYKLPIITNEYFVQLAEANEAILEIIKELGKKPIEIKVLNTRVDTARDLVLKLFHTTNEMIRTAQLTELMIVYGNRYRSEKEEIQSGLTQAEALFYKGNYKAALETTISTVDLIEPGIHDRLLSYYKRAED